MKHFRFMLGLILIAALGLTACDAIAPAPSATPAPAATMPAAAPTVVPSAEVLPSPTAEPPAAPTAAPVAGTAVSYGRLSLVVPTGVATGGTGATVPAVSGDNVAPWDIAPEKLQLKLDGYALQGKLHEPQIYVYPAEAYAQTRDAAAMSLERLRAVLAQGSGAAVTNEQLPFVPFFNATQIIASNVKVVPFANGQGVRALTQYAQGLVPVNNHELIYHFEGLTSDGKYYVIAILPVNAPVLAETAGLDEAVPAGGAPLPDLNSANPDMKGYFAKVQQALGGLQPGDFTPNLDQLDALIGSLSVAAN